MLVSDPFQICLVGLAKLHFTWVDENGGIVKENVYEQAEFGP